MKKEHLFESELVTITPTKQLGRAQNEKTSPPNPNVRMDTGKLVWKGSPLSKALLKRLIERVQES
jgi:hypothetical protein